jgi:hypothetical protein
MYTKERSDQIGGAVFLIGLGILFLGNIVSFWPGILYVIGASAIARGVAEGRAWYNVSGGLWMIGLGLVFQFGFSLPLLLILVGVGMLFGYNIKGEWWDKREGSGLDEEKRKNEDKVKNDDSLIVE